MEKIRKSPLSKGYQIKKVVSTTTVNKHDKRILNKNHYPNGVVTFIFLLAFYLIFLCTVLGVGFSRQTLGNQWWLNAIIGSGVGYFGFNLLWAIGRTGLFEIAGFGFMKFLRLMHFDIVKEKIEFYIHEPAVSDVNSVSEYKAYCIERRKYTKRWCLISLTVSGIILVISLIVYLSVFYSI